MSKRFLKILATVGILYFAAFLIIYIVGNQLSEKNSLNFITVFATLPNISPSLDLGNPIILFPIINTTILIPHNQQNILVNITIVWAISLLITTQAIRFYYIYLRVKRRKQAATVEEKHKVIPTPRKPSCLFCGSEIPENSEFCPVCGKARAKCSVCHNDLVSEDQYVKCPYCGALSHREHLLKWIRGKGYCPNCRQRLEEKDIV